jgi:hypothetical protein
MAAIITVTVYIFHPKSKKDEFKARDRFSKKPETFI